MKNDTADIKKGSGEESNTPGDWQEKARAARTAAWDATRIAYEQLQDKALEYSKATDRAIHEKPYVAIGVAFGVGLVLGYLVAGGTCCAEEEKS